MIAIRRRPLAMLLSASLLALATATAHAQETPVPALPQDPPAADEQEGDETDQTGNAADTAQAAGDDAIVVTGSRIPRAGFDTLEPATVVDSEYIQDRGLTNVADALNELPGFGTPSSPAGEQNAFGAGANFVNLYGLGTQRTLTLLNGRRVVSANGASSFSGANPGVQVDLNIITTQLVSRVENISVGGAPTYGSDAIAGTTNVIFRRDFSGQELQVTNGITERGDGWRYNASIAVGRNFAGGRGNITLSGSIDHQDGVFAIDREFFQEAFFFAANPTEAQAATIPGRTPANDGRVDPTVPFQMTAAATPDGIPNNVLIRNSRLPQSNDNGVLFPATGATTISGSRLRGFGPNQTTYLQFARGGNIVSYDPGIPFGSTFSGGQGNFPAENSQITSELDRRAATLLAHYDITDNITVFFEGIYYSADARELGDSADVQGGFLTTGVSGMLTFRNDYPLLSQQARDTLAANGITSFRFSRNLDDLFRRATSSESELIRGVVGFEGEFELGGRTFNWEVSANYGRYESTYFRTQLNQQKFVNAVNVVRNTAGQVVCSPTEVPTLTYGAGSAATEFLPVADPACVPLNLFGEGSASPEAIDYITDETTARSRQEQQVYNANLGGSLFDVWGGPVSFNLGYEHRREEAEFTPDDFQLLGLGRSVAIVPTSGSFTTNELFGEVLIPLIGRDNEIPLLYGLDLTGKVRYVHNTVNGGFFAYTVGAQWRPFRGLEIRGNYTRSLRAPAITELFLPLSERFVTVTDPCASSQTGNGTNPAIRLRNCQALYAQSNITLPFSPTSSGVRGTQQGDPDLENETSRAYSIGAVWQPIRNLTLSVDYINIEIDNVIARLTESQIATSCYDDPDFDVGNAAQGNIYCALITRAASGQITNVDSRYVNGEFLNFSGITANLLYQQNLGNYGVARLAVRFYSPQRFETTNTGITIENPIGEIGFSKTQVLANIGWDIGPVGITWQTRYVGSVRYDNTFTAESQDVLEVPAYWLHNAGLQFRVSEAFELRFAVTNLFDREPAPQSFGYDVLGRRYSATAKVRF